MESTKLFCVELGFDTLIKNKMTTDSAKENEISSSYLNTKIPNSVIIFMFMATNLQTKYRRIN